MNKEQMEEDILQDTAQEDQDGAQPQEMHAGDDAQSRNGIDDADTADNICADDTEPDEDDDSDEGADESFGEDAEGASDENIEKNRKESASEADAGSSGGKKGFFKKNKKKDKKDEKIEELTDQVRRQMAEFDNFRKRTDKEKTQMYEIGVKSMIEKVLPVVDNFERGLAAVPKEQEDDAFVDGMNKIYKQLMTMLEEADVKPIEAVGKEFDPNLHNAVMQMESDEYESGIVAQELQKGYMYRDSVVRHSMVAVVS